MKTNPFFVFWIFFSFFLHIYIYIYIHDPALMRVIVISNDFADLVEEAFFELTDSVMMMMMMIKMK